MAFERGQRFDGPVPAPCGLLGVAQVQFVVEIAPHARHQQRMALAGDHQRQRADPGAAARVLRQQRRGRMGLFEIFDDRERLHQRGAVIVDQGRQRHLRIEVAELVGAVRVGVEIDIDGFGRKALEIERDANPQTRLRSPERKEFHGRLRHAARLSCPDLIRRIRTIETFLKMDHRVKPGDDEGTGNQRPHRLLALGQMHRAVAARRVRGDVVGGDGGRHRSSPRGWSCEGM